jgi:hypothetical protein
MLKLIFGYAASTLCALLFISGLFLLMMPLSDPGEFEGEGELRDTLAISGALIIVGVGGIFGLKGFYSRHRKFFTIIGGLVSFSAVVTGAVCFNVSSESSHSILFQIASFVFAAVTFLGGMILGIMIPQIFKEKTR